MLSLIDTFKWTLNADGAMNLWRSGRHIGALHVVHDIRKYTFIAGGSPTYAKQGKAHPTNCNNIEDAKRVIETLYMLGEI